MRYYDLIETPKTQKFFLEPGDNRIPENDERVSCWFQPKTKAQDRYFDDNGYPKLKEYALDENGDRYSIYLETPDANGVYKPDLDAIATAQAESDKIQAIAELESQITQRNIRSAMLGDQWAIDHITNIETQIAALR